MPDEEVNVKIKLNVDGAKTIKDLRKELKVAQGEAIAFARAFGELSPEAIAAAKRVAELKDEVADLNERIALADPGAKFQVFGNVLKSVAGGFTAIQGAAAAFGDESEDLQKTLVKLQGAMAFTEGLSTVADSWKDFQRLGAVIKGQLVQAFTTLRGAIIATGIGALAVALGLIIANFEKIEAVIKRLFPAFEGFGKLFDKLKAVAMGAMNAIVESFRVLGDIIGDIFTGDFSGAMKTAKEAGTRIGDAYVEGFEQEVRDQLNKSAATFLNGLNENLARELKVRKAMGADVTKQEEEIARNNAAAKLLEFGAASKEYLDAQADFNALIAGNRKAAEDKAKDDAKKSADERLKQLQNQQALEKAVLETTGRDTYGLRLSQLEEQKALAIKLGTDTKDIQQQLDLEQFEQRKALNAALAEDITSTHGKITTAITNATIAQEALQARQIASSQKVSEADRVSALIKIEQENIKRQAMDATAAVLESSAQLAGEQTALGKTLAIASTTIQTYAAAQSAYQAAFLPVPTYASPFIGGAFAAAAVISGLARVKAIASIKIPGAGSGASAPAISAMSNGVQLPTSPPASMVQSTMVDQLAQVNTNLRQAQRVYVVESDITDTQATVANIKANAQF
ncbi:hypothetical protein [Chitinophaga sp. sic0106]|uniref:hypothetical protein n=1 Tax=Chitinophaga sp. sic0106 TaxID=2854785 RepID=UPI001C478795|nr:hypothetical protein [Chitinophaga sp. sic0106]MBV7534052.1 hypothetical protein [Chitinophaga sp. sic0106]